MPLRATPIFALILALLPDSSGRAGDSHPTEYQLKAAYLYHFAQFVDWPTTAFPQADAPLIIGVLGENPFQKDLPRTVEGKILGNHPLVVMEYQSLADMTNNCHILFISSSEKKHLPEIFNAIKGTTVLTVSEVDHFTENGGMINFVLDNDKIRFQINMTAVEHAGLKMSFKLLSLASKVTH